MNVNALAYLISKKIMNYTPTSEVAGAKDNPIIELAHQMTFIEDGTPHDYTDEIPWCSSWMNLVTLLGCMCVDPIKVVATLNRKKFAPYVLKEFYALFIQAVYPDIQTKIAGSFEAVMPTFDASAISWAKWGIPVEYKDAIEGDMVVLSRKGGNHITFLAESKLDMTKEFFIGLGGNQADKVCLAPQATARIIAVRRAPLLMPPPKT